jgi:hypothetical protein
MNKIKQEKGVTMLILSIIVILLIVIATVSLNLGSYDVDATVDSKLTGELKMVQYAVLEKYTKYKTTLDEDYIIGTDYNNQIEEFVNEHYSNIELVHKVQSDDEIYEKYYLVNSNDLIKLGIQDSQYSYIVNYYTGEVMNANTYITSSSKTLYVKGLSTKDINTESF